MKKFSFPLDRVLTLRQRLTDLARRALYEAQALEAGRERVLTGLISRLRMEQADLGRKQSCGVLVAELQDSRRYQEFLAREIISAQTELAEARVLVQRRREELVAARKHEKVIERLRGRRLTEYQEYVLREEQKELDEMAGARGLGGGGL
jgi:flagellar FliJ protein